MSMQELLIRAIAVVGLAWYFICLFHLGIKPTRKAPRRMDFDSFKLFR